MLIIKGVNIYPIQVERVLMAFPEVAHNYVILLDRQGPVDQITVRVEVTPQLVSQGLEGLEGFRGEITHALREEILVRWR
jgi:phenylacetate-CoA ligase